MPVSVPRRLLLVHAHPDDEVLTTGGLIAKHTSAGDSVTLVTCTLGEEGEILLPELAHLAAHRDDALGSHRVEELAASMAALGVADNRILGGAGRYRDSGMMGEPSNERPGCFWRADLREAADHLVPIIRELRPQVLVTYDDFGGYGHPDHIQAHRVAMYAAQLASVPSYRPDLGAHWDILRIFWTAMPASAIRFGIAALREAGDRSRFAAMDPDDIPFAVEDDVIDASIDVSAVLDAKVAAMRAHASQISMEEGFFALADNHGAPVFGTEFFRLAKGARPGGTEPMTDLFAGLEQLP
jgi:N-acetyl-1-D-myo-inositol-2-amino-2-deoxy-alpha-D-glucopyranoside deacetylase